MVKMNPYYTYQIDAIESWLDEQAQKGLFLDDRSGTLFSFKKGAPKNLRYRIDLKPGINDTNEQARITDYREMGWEYVCDLSRHADIYVCHNPSATELNTDEETLHEILDTLLKREIWIGVIGTILVPLLWINNLFLQNRGGYYGVYDSMINGLTMFFVPMGVLLILVWTVPMALHLYDAVQTRRRLLLTRDYHTTSRARKRQSFNRAVLVTPLLILLTLAVLWGYTKSGGDVAAEEFPGPTVTVLLPGHEPSSFIPYSNNIPDEKIWTDNLPLIRATRVRQNGFEQLDPNDEFNRQPTWIYNADLETVLTESLAEKYAVEKADSLDMEAVLFPNWENAWYVEESYRDNQNRNVFSQKVLLQHGKDVWQFGYWSYSEAPQYDLLHAVKTYTQESSSKHSG